MRQISYRHQHFYKIATEFVFELNKVSSELLSPSKINKIKIKWWKKRQMNKLQMQTYKIGRSIDVILTMTALTLESFINFYAIHYRLNEQPGYNERASTVSKWQNYTTQTGHGQLSQDTIAKIRTIMNKRNDLVHFKSQLNPPDDFEFSMLDSHTHYNYLKDIFDEMCLLNPSFNVNFFTTTIPDYANTIGIDFIAFCNHQ